MEAYPEAAVSPEIPRKPIPATLRDQRIERRQNRLALPRCPECQRANPRVTLRTDYVIYLLCEPCGTVWSVPKPGINPLGQSLTSRRAR